MKAVCVVVALLGCGGKEEGSTAAAPTGSAGSAKGSAPPAEAMTGSAVKPTAGSGSAAPTATKKATLRHEADKDQRELTVVFDGRIPVLPAISSDGKRIATFETNINMPMFPIPFSVEIAAVDGKGKTEIVTLIDDKMTMEEGERTKDTSDEPWKPPAAMLKTLRERGATVEAKLKEGGFESLVLLDVDFNNGDPKPFKIGDLTLTSTEKQASDGGALEIRLTDASNKVLHKESFKPFDTKESPPSFGGMGFCGYQPSTGAAYLDQAKRTLYQFVMFRHNEECTTQPGKLLVWALPELAPPSPDEAAIRALVSDQIAPNPMPDPLFTADAQLIAGSTVAKRDALPWHIKGGGEIYSGHDDANVQVVMSRDGKSAWASLTTTVGLDVQNDPKGHDAPWRVSSVIVKTAAGWRIAATTWTQPVTDAVSERDAKANKRKAGTFADAGDKDLRAAFAKMVSDGVDADAAKRGDLIAIGTAPGERMVGGAFPKIWATAFKGKVTVVSSTAHVAPGGTTGWVAATLELPRTGYKLPFNAFCVFDKTAAGTWSLVHAHFSI